MPPLKQVFRGVLRNWGHDIYLQRKLSDGTFSARLEKHTVRDQYPSSRGLRGVLEEEREGVIHTVDMIYYFTAEAAPNEGDRIYESDPRMANGQVTYIIDYASPNRGKGGITVFYAAGATRETPE